MIRSPIASAAIAAVAGISPAAALTPLKRTRTGFFEAQPFVQDLVWEQYPRPVDTERLKAGNSSAMALTVQPARQLDPPLAPASDGVFLDKTGGTGGFGSCVALVPGEKLGVVVLADRNCPNEVRAEATRRLIEAIEAASPNEDRRAPWSFSVGGSPLWADRRRRGRPSAAGDDP